MARKYKLITPEDREIIEREYGSGVSVVEIADMVGVSTATAYREIARGYTDRNDENGRPAYSAATAQAAIDKLKSRRRRGRPFAR